QKMRSEIAISSEKQKELQILNGMISLAPLAISKKKLPNVATWTEKDPRLSLDSFHKYASKATRKSIFRRIFPSNSSQAYGMYSRMEQAPNPHSRITLSNEVDSLGMPKTNLFWALSAIDKKSLRYLNKLVGQQVGKSGIGRVKIYDFLVDDDDDSIPASISAGWHHMGTTRMSDDPNTGVVDSNCQVHGINNLFIAGSSCFPTGGAATPTLTIVALSLRLSDYLKKIID